MKKKNIGAHLHAGWEPWGEGGADPERSGPHWSRGPRALRPRLERRAPGERLMPQGRVRQISASQLKSRVHEGARERPEGGGKVGGERWGRRTSTTSHCAYLNLLTHSFYRPPIIPESCTALQPDSADDPRSPRTKRVNGQSSLSTISPIARGCLSALLRQAFSLTGLRRYASMSPLLHLFLDHTSRVDSQTLLAQSRAEGSRRRDAGTYGPVRTTSARQDVQMSLNLARKGIPDLTSDKQSIK